MYDIWADKTNPDAKPNRIFAVKNAEYVFAKWMISQPITNGIFMIISRILWPILAENDFEHGIKRCRFEWKLIGFIQVNVGEKMQLNALEMEMMLAKGNK